MSTRENIRLIARAPLSLLLLFLLKMANEQLGSCTLTYECVDPRCENLTKCLQESVSAVKLLYSIFMSINTSTIRPNSHLFHVAFN